MTVLMDQRSAVSIPFPLPAEPALVDPEPSPVCKLVVLFEPAHLRQLFGRFDHEPSHLIIRDPTQTRVIEQW